MAELLQEREDCLARLRQEYLFTFLKIQQLTKILANAIRGTLVKKKVGKYCYYDLQVWEKGKRKRTYVRKKQLEELRRQVELRQHQERQLRGLKDYLEELRKCLRHFRVKVETIVENYRDEGRERMRQVQEKKLDQMAARQMPYGSNLKYRTLRGELVRSKSELTLANLVSTMGIPYEYGPMVRLGEVEVEADFKVGSKLDARLWYYWEHCGRMDDKEYVDRFGKKMALYRINGYREGKNLITTYEDAESGLDTQEILNILKVNRIL